MSNILNVYTFFDKKSETYDTPFFCLDDLHAQRHFHMACAKEGTMLNTFLSEFELYKLGEFDKKSCKLKLKDNPSLLMTGNQLQNVLRQHT